jgi:hypothetical protein
MKKEKHIEKTQKKHMKQEKGSGSSQQKQKRTHKIF